MPNPAPSQMRPRAAKPDSRRRWLWAFSFGLNLGLLGVLGCLAHQRWASNPPPPALPVNGPSLPLQVLEWPTAPEPEVLTNTVPFHWSQLESTNFQVYIANLRSVGCPEGIIQDLVFFELERLYAACAAALPMPDVFWASWQMRENAHRAWEADLRRLHEEKRAVQRHLVGAYWNMEAYEFWYDKSYADIAEALAGFLGERRVLQALAIATEGEEAMQEIRHEIRGAEPAERTARLRHAHKEWMQQFAAIMAPAEYEELLCRISMVDGFDHNFAGEVALTGHEMREIARLRQEVFPAFSKMWSFHGAQDGDEDEKQELFNARLRRLLGDDRSDALQRTQDYRYRHIRDIASEANLPEQIRIGAWRVCQAGDAELKRLAKAQDLAPEERVAAEQALRIQAEAALIALLGEQNSQKFLARCGNWLTK